MKDYEIVIKFLNACAGSAYPQTSFDEATLNSPEDYIRAKHGKDFEKFTKEVLSETQVVYTYKNAVTYIYEFTEI